jgi:glycosyltransferase involved in cell wall biosynthesis
MNLISAWSRARPANWQLHLVGPDGAGHRREVEALIKHLGLAESVRLQGEVSDLDKWKVFEEADLFVLPSLSENFGVVVAEALASGLPVITTTAAPWAGLVEERCGWWIDVGIEPLEAALREATALTPDQRHELGHRGREYVRRSFSWHHVATQIRAVYEWMLHGGQTPDSVRLN